MDTKHYASYAKKSIFTDQEGNNTAKQYTIQSWLGFLNLSGFRDGKIKMSPYQKDATIQVSLNGKPLQLSPEEGFAQKQKHPVSTISLILEHTTKFHPLHPFSFLKQYPPRLTLQFLQII